MKRLGLFGGSFNPVHWGHLLAARATVDEMDLDRMVFVPAATSPFKPDARMAEGSVRARMLRLSLLGQPWAEVDERELRRGGISYSIDTVLAYRKEYPEARLFYLVGSDNINQLGKWREADRLAGEVEFIVIPRPGGKPASFPTPFKGHTLRGIPTGISSSEIRSRVRVGRSIDFLVPYQVEEVIRNQHLYAKGEE